MVRIVTPGSTRSGNDGPRRSGPFFITDLLRRFGARAILALVISAVLAFAPLALLYWFNTLRLESVANLSPGQRVVIKPGQQHEDQERDEPGETALLQVRCLVPTADGGRELLSDGDQSRPESARSSSFSARRELVYLRRKGAPLIPFGLLGTPPVSVWLPAGDYQVLVVHEAPSRDLRIDLPGGSYPLVSVIAECTAKTRQKTICEIELPHYDSGNPDVLLGVGTSEDSYEHGPSPDDLVRLVAACETVTPIPTPAGYLLNLKEPRIHHRADHRSCVQDFNELHSTPREWTRSQIASLRNWLPGDASAATAHLSSLVDRLGWRQFLQGWFCYAVAGVAGLIFTRWGTIALLEPWRRKLAWNESIGLFVRIFLFSAGGWFIFQVLFH